jgi:hypothetical protein
MSLTNIRRYDLSAGDQHVLDTRERGLRIGREVADILRGVDALVLSFSGIRLASYPFLDELLTQLKAALIGSEDRFMAVAGCNADVRESLSNTLRQKKMQIAAWDDDLELLPGGSAQLNNTYEVARREQTFTAATLAEELGVKLPALHQRLNALMEAGAVSRVFDPNATRGKRGIYSVVDEDALRRAMKG